MNLKDYENLEKLDTPEDLIDLDGKVGLIAGGNGNMGRQFASFLCKAGAKVIIVDINSDVEKINLNSTKGEIIGIACDLSSGKEVVELFDHLKQKFGKLDFLISTIMSRPEGYYEKFETYDVKTWNEVMSGNVTSSFMLCQHASSLMKVNGGSIILTSSIYGLVGPDYRIYEDSEESSNPYDSNRKLTLPHSYSASKGALISLCKSLSTELSVHNIRVNTLIPGGVYDNQNPSFHDKYVARTPLGRMATWTDFNGAVLFLVSDFSRYMTGTSLVVDGGWTAW